MTKAELDHLHHAGIITAKEHAVLELHGLSDRTIAQALDISRSAIRDRRRNALEKIARHQRRTAA